MNTVKTAFIQTIIEKLLTYNDESRSYNLECVDIPCVTAPIDDNFYQLPQELIDDITTKPYEVMIGPQINMTRNTEIEIRVNIMYDEYETSHVYVIIPSVVSDYQGYCACQENEIGYNTLKRCTGVACDWDRPSFQLEKTKYYGEFEWGKLQKDFWAYEQDVYNNQKIEVTQEKIIKKKQNIERIKERIRKMNLELDEQEKELQEYEDEIS